MEEEEVKGAQPQLKVRPRVQNMKACIVSMEYKIKNEENNTPQLNQLAQSYADAEKVSQLFLNTLKWPKDDVITFKDSYVSITNIHNKIDNHIKDLKSAAKIDAKEHTQQLNVLAFIGHGIINE
jgi:hypothetical protein